MTEGGGQPPVKSSSDGFHFFNIGLFAQAFVRKLPPDEAVFRAHRNFRNPPPLLIRGYRSCMESPPELVCSVDGGP
jgi:hypothetical protein